MNAFCPNNRRALYAIFDPASQIPQKHIASLSLSLYPRHSSAPSVVINITELRCFLLSSHTLLCFYTSLPETKLASFERILFFTNSLISSVRELYESLREKLVVPRKTMTHDASRKYLNALHTRRGTYRLVNWPQSIPSTFGRYLPTELRFVNRSCSESKSSR